MTVSTTINKVSYTGNGIAVEFAVPFPFLDVSHLRVYQLLNDVQTQRMDWTEKNGNLIFETAPVSGAQIVIMREVPLTQETDYRENEILAAETLESNFDRLTMQIQQLKEQTERAVTIDVFDNTQAADLLPSIRTAVSTAAEYAQAATQQAQESLLQAQNAAASATTANEQAAIALNAISNKADKDVFASKDVRGVAQWGSESISETTPAVVIESWFSGANWYRVWSDGWIEQGGFAVEGIANIEGGLALLKPYSTSTSYTLMAVPSCYTKVDGYNYFATTNCYSTTHATVLTRGHGGTVDSRGFTWRANGY